MSQAKKDFKNAEVRTFQDEHLGRFGKHSTVNLNFEVPLEKVDATVFDVYSELGAATTEWKLRIDKQVDEKINKILEMMKKYDPQ